MIAASAPQQNWIPLTLMAVPLVSASPATLTQVGRSYATPPLPSACVWKEPLGCPVNPASKATTSLQTAAALASVMWKQQWTTFATRRMGSVPATMRASQGRPVIAVHPATSSSLSEYSKHACSHVLQVYFNIQQSSLNSFIYCMYAYTHTCTYAHTYNVHHTHAHAHAHTHTHTCTPTYIHIRITVLPYCACAVGTLSLMS